MVGGVPEETSQEAHLRDVVARAARVIGLGADFRWPGARRVAVVFNVAFEAWSDGKAPGLSPMGNPLAAKVFDTNALSWGNYGPVRGMARLLRALDRVKLKASVMVSGVLAERAPATVRQIAAAGHDIVAHGYAQDVIPAALGEKAVGADIARTTEALAAVTGAPPTGWVHPPRTAAHRRAAPAPACWARPATSGRATPSTTTGPTCRNSTRRASSRSRSPWRSTTCRMRCGSAACRASSSRSSTPCSATCSRPRTRRS